VLERLSKAGIRLGAMLNRALGEGPEPVR
jgi:hypothetical protein